MALLLEAAELLEANATHAHVVIVDTFFCSEAKVFTFSDAAAVLNVNGQQLDDITKSHTLYQGRYFVIYQGADPLPCPASLLEPLKRSLKVRIVVDDEDEDADELKACIKSQEAGKVEGTSYLHSTFFKKTRHGETRKGKCIKAVKGSETIYFSSQSSFGKFIGLKKGSISACLVKKPKKCMIRGWTLTRVPRSLISIVSV